MLDEIASGIETVDDRDTREALEDVEAPDRIELDESTEMMELLERDVRNVLEGAAGPKDTVALVEYTELDGASEELDWAVLVEEVDVELGRIMGGEDEEVGDGNRGGDEEAHSLRIFFMYRVKLIFPMTFLSAAVASHSITPPNISG